MGKYSNSSVSVKRILVFNQNGLLKCTNELDEKGHHINTLNPQKYPSLIQSIPSTSKPTEKNKETFTQKIDVNKEITWSSQINRIDDFESMYKREGQNSFIDDNLRIDTTFDIGYDVSFDYDLNVDFSNFFESLS